MLILAVVTLTENVFIRSAIFIVIRYAKMFPVKTYILSIKATIYVIALQE